MWALIIAGIGFGIAYCAPPGAVTAESLRRGLAGGFRPVFMVQMGSLIGDGVWATLALGGAAVLVQNTAARLILGAIGVFFLARLALDALTAARQRELPAAALEQAGSDFRVGAVLSLANPWAVAFWLGVGGSLATVGVATPSAGDYAAFLTGFMTGALLYAICVSGLIGWGSRFVRPGIFRWVNVICGCALGLFAVRLLMSTLGEIL